MNFPVFNSYDRKARLYPALIAVLPALLVLAVWFPLAWKIWTGFGALIAATGLTYLMGRVARTRGRALQAAMERADGRRSTVALRHRDDHLNAHTRQRYHAALRAAGLVIPTPEEEAMDPHGADVAYASAVDWLRERTRNAKKYPLIMAENIEFGFRRNLVGLRPIAIALLVMGIAADFAALIVRWNANEARCWAGVALVALQGGLLTGWTFAFTTRFVDDASWAYTDRILAALEDIARAGCVQTKPKVTKRSPKKAETIPAGESG